MIWINGSDVMSKVSSCCVADPNQLASARPVSNMKDYTFHFFLEFTSQLSVDMLSPICLEHECNRSATLT